MDILLRSSSSCSNSSFIVSSHESAMYDETAPGAMAAEQNKAQSGIWPAGRQPCLNRVIEDSAEAVSTHGA